MRQVIRYLTGKFAEIAFILMIATTLSGCSWLFPKDKDDYDFNLADYPSIEYDLHLEVVGDESLKSFIKDNSKLESLKNKPPISTNALRYRMLQDIKNIRHALKHKGYFDAKVEANLENKNGAKLVDVFVQTGPKYTISGFSLEILDHDQHMKLTPSKLARVMEIEVGDLVDQDKIFEANLRLEKHFKNHGYPFVKMEVPDGKVNKDKKALSIIFKATLNGVRKYGNAYIRGVNTISEKYVRNRIVWRQGEIYDDRLVERTKRKLIDSELFSSVSILPSKEQEVEDTEVVPLKIELVEAPPRLIGAGIDYTTSQGVGGRFAWEHRNLLGGGEALKLEAKGTRKQAKSRISFEVPDIFMPDLNFITWLEARYNNTLAYKGHVYDAYVGLKYEYLESIHAFLGIEYERSKLTRTVTQRENYFSIPLSVLVDMRNDVINPYKGWRVLGEVTPYYGSLGQSNKMLRFLLNANYYLRMIKKDTFVIGFWGRVGQIQLIKNADIPLDKRFYSGGLNSVRGYGYQKLGPIDQNGNPAGGKRLIEFGVEPRFKITDTIGGVAFVEAGFVGQDEPFSQEASRYLIGYGVGLRYYTAIGPIRLDVAFPAKKRHVNGKRYDSPVQLYISIGQAF